MSKTWVAVQSRGPGNTHHEGTYLQLGSPAICVCVWLCACICRQAAYYTKYLHPPNSKNLVFLPASGLLRHLRHLVKSNKPSMINYLILSINPFNKSLIRVLIKKMHSTVKTICTLLG